MKLWKFLLLLGSLVLLGGAALLAVNFLVLPSLIHSQQVVTMPDLRSMDLAVARDEVRGLDLQIEVSRQRPHPTLPEGRILDQTPVPGARIRGGRMVKVVLSSGHASGRLAALIGLTPEQAEVTLQREKYRSGRVVRIPRPDVTQPVVAFQSPQAGVELETGRRVDLVVAGPSAPVQLLLPDLTDMPLYQARQMVNAAGLVLAPVQYKRSGDIAPNHILSQDPPAGSRVGKGDLLALVIATR